MFARRKSIENEIVSVTMFHGASEKIFILDGCQEELNTML